ncbi:response regulator [Pendulispora brunnea]|uniref:Response regulator n=1 Tax=Pendulispora brunnea TaxID=2905690 RepID=A0ABZ2KBX1_9BACT
MTVPGEAGRGGGSQRRPLHDPPRVLVAEDDPEMRRIVVEALRRDGYDVREAADGGRLLICIDAQSESPSAEIDLIISDVRMPVCTGLQALDAVRRTQSPLPIILMTAFGDDELRTHAEARGALLFDKPFALEDLRATVNMLCRG